MATCAFCKTQETQLYENDVPVCLKCADSRKPVNVHAILMRNLHEATLRAESASTEFNAITSDIPSFIPPPDATQRIHNASRELTEARNAMMKAHKRLNDFVERGIVPDDLERSVGK